ncbi:MAG: EamA family transporter [Streptosporangiaceae bacterium]
MLAGLFLAVDLVLWNHAIADVGAGIATVLGNLQVLFVALIAWALLRERPDRRFLAMLITSALPRLPAAFSSLLLLLQPAASLLLAAGRSGPAARAAPAGRRRRHLRRCPRRRQDQRRARRSGCRCCSRGGGHG